MLCQHDSAAGRSLLCCDVGLPHLCTDFEHFQCRLRMNAVPARLCCWPLVTVLRRGLASPLHRLRAIPMSTAYERCACAILLLAARYCAATWACLTSAPTSSISNVDCV